MNHKILMLLLIILSLTYLMEGVSSLLMVLLKILYMKFLNNRERQIFVLLNKNT